MLANVPEEQRAMMRQMMKGTVQEFNGVVSCVDGATIINIAT